jgi:hypothetical protein
MNADQYLVVRCTPDFKSYTYWVVDTNGQQLFGSDGLPIEAPSSVSNRTTSKSTLGTAIQNELPTLGT